MGEEFLYNVDVNRRMFVGLLPAIAALRGLKAKCLPISGVAIARANRDAEDLAFYNGNRWHAEALVTGYKQCVDAIKASMGTLDASLGQGEDVGISQTSSRWGPTLL